jgi:phospholipase C
MSRITRRQLLKLGAAGAVGLGGVTWSQCKHRRTGSRVERPIELIEHVVIIYQENWSFDSLFGRFPGANGIANAGDTVKQVDNDGAPYSVLPRAMDNRNSPATVDARIPAKLPVAPFDLSRYVAPDECSGNPLHRYYQHIEQINGGKMDKFVALSNVGALTMSYYDATNLPLGRLAQHYVLCDNFFQAGFGGSTLNHIWLIAAATAVWPDAPAEERAELDGDWLGKDGDVSPDGYVINNAFTVNTPHPARITDPKHLMPNQTLPTIGDRLSERNISWAWYAGGWNEALAGRPHPLFQPHHQPFAYFANYADGTRAKREHLKDEEDFWRDLAGGRLPAVSFFKPIGPLNEHPGYADLLGGQQYVERVVHAIMASSAWPRTAIVITYDEYGGRWDHVAPPVVDRWGPGSRVPTVVISPYAKRGFVDHTLYDMTSILKFIETRWKLRPLSARDAQANDMTAAFDFTQTPA